RHALVLAVERQVVQELVDDQAGQQAHVGDALAERGSWSRRTATRATGLALDYRPPEFQPPVRRWLLREAQRRLLAHDLVLFVDRRRRDTDFLDGNRVAEPNGVFVGRLVALRATAAVMLGDGDFSSREHRRSPFTQRELSAVGIDEPPLRLLPEQLLLEPVELALLLFDARSKLGIVRGKLMVRREQRDDVLMLHRLRLLVERHADFLSHRASSAKNYSVKNQLERTIRELLRRVIRGKLESPSLETLGEQAVARAIPRDQLQVVAAVIEEHEQRPRQRVFRQH